MARRWVQNAGALETTPERAAVLDIVEAGLDAIDTTVVVNRSVKLTGDLLTIDGQLFDLRNFGKLYVLGFGKASAKAALALEGILGERITDGVVVSNAPAPTERIRCYVGTHPLPSRENVTIAERMRELVARVKPEDLVLCLVSGGGSALLCWTEAEREQGVRLYESYLSSGDDIKNLNTVRKHISEVKGGGLAKLLYPATVASLIFSDIAGNSYHFVDSGPTYPDSSTVADAQAIVDRYGLGSFQLTETPKDPRYFERVYNMPVISNVIALERMADRVRTLGLEPRVVSSELYETADRTMALLLGASAPGTVALAGSEMKLLVDRPGGKGGRNAYLALKAVEQLGGRDTFAAVASDGLDNSDAAGAIVDAGTLARARAAGTDPASYLGRFDPYTAFASLGHELMFTGPTEANVSDFLVLYRAR